MSVLSPTAARTPDGGVLDRDGLRDILPVVVSVLPFAAIVLNDATCGRVHA